ncbi:MAG: hypothetical protein RMY64_05210 [Nostoc sp. DedQUE08]|uniref:hypothetical protein n=1 Tax=unclassified Nostoc TaxID=2593658 RepID=UPI002AD3FEDE|nr:MULTISPECIES: hypothetical protein [unclassified Nostoc]MDZ8091664.1 hypothetical protein [Nostoc sp. DedQUE05]MDZ8029997.1 hypothetical protein [Nostoc sp. DedSLP04]MDZ8065027.1 hypothetical protein [Nostoc sp. DedQUE08]MDZ8131522.1 hypothetical protein [Nostoc sp. DedQUE07]MDZ8134576.1 hypothetical protein [Nostoc sp. DedQUE04]
MNTKLLAFTQNSGLSTASVEDWQVTNCRSMLSVQKFQDTESLAKIERVNVSLTEKRP